MAHKTTWTGDKTTPQTITGGDNVATLVAGASISIVRGQDTVYAITDDGTQAANNHIVVNGRIYATTLRSEAASFGVEMDSPGGGITIGANGSILASDPIYAHGAMNIVNRGSLTSLSDSGSGITLWSNGGEVHNYGTITAYYGIMSERSNGTIVNEKTGVITAYGAGVADHFGTLTLINHGLIEALGGAAAFVQQGNGYRDQHIVNDGRIIGSIYLGGGYDTVDMRGGTITGTIQGDYGAKILITDDADIRLILPAGSDIDEVKSTVSYKLNANVENLTLIGGKDANGNGNELSNLLKGNRGDNVLKAGGSADVINGGAGNDHLWGGSGIDKFVFSTGFGHDVVMDYESLDEHFDIRRWRAVDDYAELRSHMQRQDDGIMIAFGNDSLFIEHATKADLGASHFYI